MLRPPPHFLPARFSPSRPQGCSASEHFPPYPAPAMSGCTSKPGWPTPEERERSVCAQGRKVSSDIGEALPSPSRLHQELLQEDLQTLAPDDSHPPSPQRPGQPLWVLPQLPHQGSLPKRSFKTIFASTAVTDTTSRASLSTQVGGRREGLRGRQCSERPQVPRARP